MDENIKQLIGQVRARAMVTLEILDEQSLDMDLHSAEEQVQLDWERMLSFDDFNFIHDIVEIRKSINRSRYPGTFPDWFLPRCGIRKAASTPAAHE